MRKFPRSALFEKGPVRAFNSVSKSTKICGCETIEEKGVRQDRSFRYRHLKFQYEQAKSKGAVEKV